MHCTKPVIGTPKQYPIRTIAHVSDLHIGHSIKQWTIAQAMHEALLQAQIDQVVVTGDITEHGRDAEYQQFLDLFGDLAAAGKLIVVPGNHDRLNDGAGRHMMDGVRVDTVQHPDLHLIRVDSTGPHNRSWFRSHGIIDTAIIQAVGHAILEAAPGALVVIALHHHLLPLPADLWAEKVVTWLGRPYALELSHGKELIEHIQGKCDLVLHGHRHQSKETILPGDRPLHIYNAGSSTEIGHFRVFRHQAGQLIGEPIWI